MDDEHFKKDPPRILIVDDEANMRHMMAALLSDAGYRVDTAEDGRQALEKVAEESFAYIFCDIKMPEMDGMTFMKQAGDHLAATEVIMMSAYGTIDTAVAAMKLGAYDYISKPFKPDEVLLTLEKAREREKLKSENSALKQRLREIEQSESFGGMVAKSSAMQTIFKVAEKVAQYDTTVLITGESGTGKELVARGIHMSSKRAQKSIVPVNCAGIPANLLESELFGYKKGAFTGAGRDYGGLFEAAAGGTIFLDEIGDLPLSLQVKLLRVLQDREIRPVGASQGKQIDVRIIVATSKNLAAEAKAGTFREDLFYRLNVMPIHLPPLIERTEDIALLCRYFIDRYSKKLDKPVTGISSEAMALLFKHRWPGNVRELENMIERAVVLAEDAVLQPQHFPALQQDPDGVSDDIYDAFSGFSIKAGKETLERVLIRKALEATAGNRTHAARLLEISHPSLLSKIKFYGIET
ncbi:MAG: sigma-54-dependent transcriptional regulator [Thermodesulfobacteriota bacterium]